MKSNPGLKIIALLVALFIWLQTTLMTQHESRTGLNLKLVNSTGEDSLHLPPRNITCTVEGRGLDILRLKLAKAHIQMEAADFWAGNALAYQVVNMPANLNVKVLGVIPPSLAEQVKAQSPAQAREEPVSSRTKPPGGPGGAEPRPDPGEQLQTSILSDLPIDAPGGLKLFPARATLKVRGPAVLLDRLPAGVRVFISTQPDARGLYSLDAELPEGTTLQDITPKQVRAER